MMTGTSGARARRACQRFKDHETGRLAQRDDLGLAADAVR
jgi:hypothetical protein